MGRFYRNSIYLVGLLVIAATCTDVFLTKVFFKERKYSSKFYKCNWQMGVHDQHFDYVFVGNSRIYRHVKPRLFDELSGSKSINLAEDGIFYAECFLNIHHFLKNGNSLDTLVIGAGEFSFYRRSQRPKFKQYNFIPEFWDTETRELFKEKVDCKRYYQYSIPGVRYAMHKKRYGLLSYENLKLDPYESTMGFQGTKLLSFEDTFNYRNMKLFGIEHETKQLKRLLTLANKKGIHVVLCTPPVYQKALDAKEYRHEFDKKLEDLKTKYDFNYLNFRDTYLSHDTANFIDALHLKEHAASRFTRDLHKALKKNSTSG